MKQPSKEGIQKAYDEGCEDVKKVIKNLWPEEFEKKIIYDRDKIYAAHNGSHVLKLTTNWTYDDFYWSYLDRTEGFNARASTAIQSIKEAEYRAYKIEVFDNEKDFFTWALKQIA